MKPEYITHHHMLPISGTPSSFRRGPRACLILALSLIVLCGIVLPSRAEDRTYTVQAGDTLRSIAARELGDANRWSELARINHLSSPYRIDVGQVLHLSGDAPAAATGTRREKPRREQDAAPSVTVRLPQDPVLPDPSAVDAELLTPPVATLPSTAPVDATPIWPENLRPRPGQSMDNILSRPITMPQAVAVALVKAPEIRQAQAGVEAARAGVGIARSSALPQVSASASATAMNNINAISPASTYDYNLFSGSLTLEQVIFTFGQISSAIKYAKENEASALAQLADACGKLRYNVEAAYLGLLLAKEQLDVAREALAVNDQLMAQAQAKLDAGTGTLYALMQAQANRAAKLSAVVAAQSGVDEARENLVTTMGLPPATPIEISGSLYANAMPIMPDEAVKLALAEQPSLLALERQVEASQTNIEYQRALGRPTIGATASAGYSKYDWTSNSIVGANPHPAWTEASNVSGGVAVSVPIFQGYKVQESTRQAAAQAQEMASQLDRAKLSVTQNVRALYLSLGANLESLAADRAGTASAREALRMSQVSFAAGMSTALDVIQDALTLSTSRSQEAQDAYNYQLDLSKLIYAVGSDSVIAGQMK